MSKRRLQDGAAVALTAILLGILAVGQSGGEYKPKFAGDPARSESEAAALGYVRTVLYSERIFHKRHGKYAASLAELVGQGSFTKRMVNPSRGDYTVRYHAKNDGFTLVMEPKQVDATHRSFYADETGKIRGEEGKTATAESEVVK